MLFSFLALLVLLSLSESGRSVADNGRASGAGSLGGGGELKMMMMICGDCQDARDAITL